MERRARPSSQFLQDERKRERKRKRGKNQKLVEGAVDRISTLPDELVASIVSLLPVKEAAATSILISRRWHHVWKYSRTSLNFFDAKFDLVKGIRSFLELKRQAKVQESCRYIDWVDHVVQQHSSPTIQHFRACFNINNAFTDHVDKWIEFAMNKRVQILELEFYIEHGDVVKDIYQFPHKLLGLEKESAADPPCLHSCGSNIGFNFLKVLHFRCVDVRQQVLEYFLSNCPLLEQLTVCSAPNLFQLRVVGPSIALKHLRIKVCLRLTRIDVCDANNLVSFCFFGSEDTNLVFVNVPSTLVEVSYRAGLYSNHLPFTKLSCCLSQLERLKLDIGGVDCNQNHVFPKFANLKQLELQLREDCLYNLSSFMKASPYLQRLVLKLEDVNQVIMMPTAPREIRNDTPKSPHHHLKVVEIVGYRGRKGDVQHVMYLVKNALALQKIIIDPVRRWCVWPSEKDRGAEEVEKEVKAREHAVQHLKGKVPSTIEFVSVVSAVLKLSRDLVGIHKMLGFDVLMSIGVSK